ATPMPKTDRDIDKACQQRPSIRSAPEMIAMRIEVARDVTGLHRRVRGAEEAAPYLVGKLPLRLPTTGGGIVSDGGVERRITGRQLRGVGHILVLGDERNQQEQRDQRQGHDEELGERLAAQRRS